ncbi:hypothetical protein BDZ85DRAFT_25229 [Elsinoe ampelina]|uniref:F-box domain-containing protein n=1 Tax=Elsinoe ampelina TaxID=302913 RepID=A0A6A6G6F9_9PEZI|nr:hypothetical protein BDZ85DRAFT_25229 [Elsinoe ampelina]
MLTPLLPTFEVSDPCGLFRLPLEIRHQIYSYLISRETISSPVAGADIASVSLKPPSTVVLTVSKSLSADVFSYFIENSLWCVNIQYAFNFFRADPDLNGLVSWPFVQHLRKIHLVVTINRALLLEYPGLTVGMYCMELAARLDKICQTLSSAGHLKTVLISFHDGSTKSAPEQKAQIFEGLSRLPKHTEIHTGALQSIDISEVSISSSGSGPLWSRFSNPNQRFIHFLDSQNHHSLSFRVRKAAATLEAD